MSVTLRLTVGAAIDVPVLGHARHNQVAGAEARSATMEQLSGADIGQRIETVSPGGNRHCLAHHSHLLPQRRACS